MHELAHAFSEGSPYNIYYEDPKAEELSSKQNTDRYEFRGFAVDTANTVALEISALNSEYKNHVRPSYIPAFIGGQNNPGEIQVGNKYSTFGHEIVAREQYVLPQMAK
jgi:hypothetical protein